MFFLPSNLFYFLSILEDENCDRFKAVSSQELERKSCSYTVLSSYYFQYKGDNGPFLGGPRKLVSSLLLCESHGDCAE